MSNQQIVADSRRRQIQKDFLSDRTPAYATTLVALLVDHWGDTEWFEWEPQSVEHEIQRDFGINLTQSVKDRLFALLTALTTDRFYGDPLVFNHICNALSGGPVPMRSFEPAELAELCWGVTEVLLNDHQGDDFEEFGPEVRLFVGQLLEEAGQLPFEPIEWAEKPNLPISTLSADPEMVQAQTQERQEQRDEISQLIEANLLELQRQLDQLAVPSDGRNRAARRPAGQTVPD